MIRREGRALRHIAATLSELDRQGLLRSPRAEPLPAGALLLCSNDYLGYGAEPWEPPVGPSGAGASRLVSGDHAAHRAAEDAIARWVGAEAALLFSSGYAANVGLISSLASRGDLIVSDRLNHASIIDGCRLSGAAVAVVPHLDARAVERALGEHRTGGRRWVVTESYFSMDGDEPDLPRLRAICDAADAALIVDEAHAVGVFGPQGAGLCAEAGVEPDVLVGTLGKAVGLQGAFVAGARALRTWLWNRARSFVFSTALSPALAHAITSRVTRVAKDTAARERLHGAAERIRAMIPRSSPIGGRRGPILPWLVGDANQALATASRLAELGIIAPAIRPPSVPPGTARIRLTASAALTSSDLDRVAAALQRFT